MNDPNFTHWAFKIQYIFWKTKKIKSRIPRVSVCLRCSFICTSEPTIRMWAVERLMKFPVQWIGLLDATCVDTGLIGFACFHRTRPRGNPARLDPYQTRPGLQFRDASVKKKKKKKSIFYSIIHVKIPQNNRAATGLDLKKQNKKQLNSPSYTEFKYKLYLQL